LVSYQFIVPLASSIKFYLPFVDFEFWVACQEGNLEEAKKILKKAEDKGRTVDINKPHGFLEQPPLCIVTQKRNPSMVRFLLELEKTDPNKKDLRGWYPLSIAIYTTCRQTAQLLLEDPRVSVPPFHRACGLGNREVVLRFLGEERELSTKGLCPIPENKRILNSLSRESLTPLHFACFFCQGAILSLLLQHPYPGTEQKDAYDKSPFFLACQSGSLVCVKLLAQDPGVDVNKQTSLGWTPLLAACAQGWTEVVNFLCKDPRIDPNYEACSGETPLIIACGQGNLKLVETLLASNQIITVEERTGISHLTAYELALKRGKKEIADLLLAYQENPRTIRHQLRRKLGWYGRVFPFLIPFSSEKNKQTNKQT